MENFSQTLKDEAEKKLLPQGETLTPEEYRKWLSRLKFAHQYHCKELIPKYRIAKKRYNSEIGYFRTLKQSVKHEDINLLFKDVRGFIGSVFFQNPEVDFTARSDDENEHRNIENLEQAVNDDIKDNREFKALIRSMLIDESLAGLAALYIDYEYDAEDSGIPIGYNQQPAIDPATGQPMIDPMTGQPVLEQVPITDDMGNPMTQQIVKKNKVCIYKIRPENILRPPYQQFYNYKSCPYLGYVDIVSLEELQKDSSLDQEVVKKCKGKEYKSLMNTDLYADSYKNEKSQDNNYVRRMTVFIRDYENDTVKRLVIADDEETDDQPLSYGDWSKGHGKEGNGYPVHVLCLNEPADSFIPPSEAWILESVLKIMDYLWTRMIKHVRRSATRTFIKTGANGLDKAELDKIAKNMDQELIGVGNLPAAIPIQSIIHQMQDAVLSGDIYDMFGTCREMFDSISRQPQFSKPSVINQKKTATESQMMQQADNTVNGDYIDKMKDFFIDLFIDWGKLIQNNFQGVRKMKVENKITGEFEDREATSDNYSGEFNADVNVESFMAPNREMKRLTTQRTLQDLTMMAPVIKASGRQLNVKKLIDGYCENVDIRDSEDLLLPKPIRTIDQQVMDYVFKGVPFAPEDVVDTEESKQRLLQIFADDQMMADFEKFRPGISGQQSELIAFIQMLDGVQKGADGKSQRPIKASDDMRVNAGMMAAGAR